jgi:hypothetical protein
MAENAGTIFAEIRLEIEKLKGRYRYRKEVFIKTRS